MNILIRAAAIAAICAAVPTMAPAASKTFTVEPFTAVDITSGINATVTVGGALAVSAESPNQGALDELKLEVSGGRLKAYVDWNILDFLLPDRQLKLTITVPSLDAVDASSGSDVLVTGLSGDTVTIRASSGSDLGIAGATGKRYDIEASSGSDLDLDGTCESARIEASSGSDVDATKLLCTDVEANASSGSDLDIYASAGAKADASSGSDVKVHGNPPRLEENESSGGEIERD